PSQLTGEKPGLRQDLEAVADAQDRAAATREIADRRHHRALSGERPAPEVVTEAEAARQNDCQVTGQVCLVMPHHAHGRAEHGLKGMPGVVVTVAPREADDRDALARRGSQPLTSAKAGLLTFRPRKNPCLT